MSTESIIPGLVGSPQHGNRGNRDVDREERPAGFLYVLINPAMPDLVKIGRTAEDPTRRAIELGKHTGVPTPFILVYRIQVADPVAAEQWVFKELKKFREAKDREFFRVKPWIAIDKIREAASRWPPG